MSYRTVRILSIEPREDATGAEYLRLKTATGTIWCRDRKMFDRLKDAYLLGTEITLDVIDRNVKLGGDIVTMPHAVGWEHPGQGKLFA